MAKIKARHQEIAAFVSQYQDKHGIPPTIREVGEAVGIASTSATSYALKRCVDAGLLIRRVSAPNTTRVYHAASAASAPAPREGLTTARALAAVAQRVADGEYAPAALTRAIVAALPSGHRRVLAGLRVTAVVGQSAICEDLTALGLVNRIRRRDGSIVYRPTLDLLARVASSALNDEAVQA